MPIFDIETPNGRKFQIDAPDMNQAATALQSYAPAKDTKAPSYAMGLARSFSEGVPVVGGLLNKASAATNATLAPALNPLFADDEKLTGTWDERYRKSLAEQEGMDKAFGEQHPVAKSAAEIAGAVASTGAAATTNLGAQALGLTAKTLPGMIGSGAASGAAVGAADAATRGGDASEGAVYGGLAGAAGPLVGRAVGAGASKLMRTGRAAMTPEVEAATQIAEALEKDAGKGLSVGDFAEAQQRGQPVAMMDIGSQATQRLARRASNFSPEAQETLGRTIGSRYRTQNDRTADWLNTTFNFPNSDETQAALSEVARSVNRPAYARAYSEGAHGLWNDDLAQISQAPVVQDSIRKAMVSAKNEAAKLGFGTPANPFTTDAEGRIVLKMGEDGKQMIPNLQFWDIVKRGLDKAGTREAKEWSNILRNTLDEQVPSYATARAGAAKAFGAQDALEAGKNAVDAKMTNRQMRDALGKMSDVEKRLFQDGFVDQYVQKIREAPDRRNIIDMVNASPSARERVVMAIGPQRAKEMEAFLRVEDQMDRARRAMGNSTTAQQIGDMKVGAMDLFDPKQMLVKMFHGASKMAGRGIDERVAEKIADMLTSTDRTKFDRAIKAIANSKSLMSAIRNPSEAAGAVATRGAAQGGAAAIGQ